MKILITSTSFQDTKGKHHDLIQDKQWDIFYLRGPLSSEELIGFNEKINGLICGDDEINKLVLDKFRYKDFCGISKYGIGLDKIDLHYADEMGIRIKNCSGVNSDTVAEHVFAKILSFTKNLHSHYFNTKQGIWKRFAGSDLKDKTIMIVGFGSIGSRVAEIAKVFKMNVVYVDPNVQCHHTKSYEKISDGIDSVDFLSLHTNLNKSTYHLIDKEVLDKCKSDLVIVNTSRGDVVSQSDILHLLHTKKIRAYLTDVLSEEPMTIENELYNSHNNIFITPHTASRTIDNVENQAIESIDNMQELINGNKFV